MKNRNIPNCLTGIRILFVPLFLLFFAAERQDICAVLFVLSGITDVLDGFLARKMNCISALGKILDPIADKLTYACAIFCLFAAGRIPLYFVIVFCVIQLSQGVGALFVYKNKSTVVHSNIFGKLAGFSMFLLCALLLAYYPHFAEFAAASHLLCSLTIGFMALAGISYFLCYIKKPQNKHIKP